ncbi:DUF5677 domain-containing protein [Cryptosporangium arvum]|uniref:Uncharacterized protein n=1 Tax=Cryptosporangium arvum DSM 44712 TaxID=927661 RepID=A0A010ZRM0_9ACTN|nr:DUF5677 domain-containing protein [Cryptosporangium arvum]EXG79862.1 hypothetical protein CryarDRAFT_0912 [Cryptosporangium arvum DSM 44712]
MQEDTPLWRPSSGLADGEPDWAALQRAHDENAFMRLAVELLKSTVALAEALVHAASAKPMALHAAVRCGLLVRSCKLSLDLLADACVGHGRQQIGLTRQLLETLANLAYLCADDESGERHRAFLYNSLISEREFLKVIERRQREDGGAELPIERRLRRSIEDTARAAGINLDEIPGRRQIKWPHAQELIELAFGPTSYPSYRVGSDALHGGWFDLIRNHLREVDGGFMPEFQPLPRRPQPLLAAAAYLGLVAGIFLRSLPDAVRVVFERDVSTILGYAVRADHIHEGWLNADTSEESQAAGSSEQQPGV